MTAVPQNCDWLAGRQWYTREGKKVHRVLRGHWPTTSKRSVNRPSGWHPARTSHNPVSGWFPDCRLFRRSTITPPCSVLEEGGCLGTGGKETGPVLENGKGTIVFVGGDVEQEALAVGTDIVADHA